MQLHVGRLISGRGAYVNGSLWHHGCMPSASGSLSSRIDIRVRTYDCDWHPTYPPGLYLRLHRPNHPRLAADRAVCRNPLIRSENFEKHGPPRTGLSRTA